MAQQLKYIEIYSLSEDSINDKLEDLDIKPSYVINIETKKDRVIVWYKTEQ